MSRDLTLCFDINAYMFTCAKDVSLLPPDLDFRQPQEGTTLPTAIHIERESPLHGIVERAVEHDGGKVESVWWDHSGGEGKEVTTSVNGEDIQWCRVGDVVRLAKEPRDDDEDEGPLLVWSQAVLAMLAVLPPKTVVYVWWS